MNYRFPSAWAAYCFCYEILEPWRNGKGYDPDPEQYRGGTGAMGAVVAALAVEKIADEHDPGMSRQPHPAIKPRDRTLSWFVQAFVPQLEPRNWTPTEKWQLDIAICKFCLDLVGKGIAGQEGCSGRCPGKKNS